MAALRLLALLNGLFAVVWCLTLIADITAALP
jgi:hypothetical protein